MTNSYTFSIDYLSHLQSLINLADGKASILLTIHSVLFAGLTFAVTQIIDEEIPTFGIVAISLAISYILISFIVLSIFVIYPRGANKTGDFIDPIMYFEYSAETLPETSELIKKILLEKEKKQSQQVKKIDNDEDFYTKLVIEQISQLDDIVVKKFYWIKISILTSISGLLNGLTVILIELNIQILPIILFISALIPLRWLFPLILKIENRF